MPIPVYSLDVTGLSSANLVSHESHTLTEINGTNHRYMIPTYGPFHLNNMSARHVSSTMDITPLVPDVDYRPGLPFVTASRSLGKMIYGGFDILTDFPNGTIEITYQTLGDIWIADPTLVLEALANSAWNPRIITWDQVTNVQQIFPPIVHTQVMDSIYGHQALIDAINEIAVAILSKPVPTKHMVGLGNVPNYEQATDAEVIAADPVDKFITLRQLVLFNSTHNP